MLLNQWANVVRWELRPRIFLRTTEFLWQEGHTAHATQAEARAYALRILQDVYEDFAVNVLALPVLVGRKTERERFAGADATYTIEGMMGDGKALQMGTSHELGQNFAKAFGIRFQTDSGTSEFAWQTSWGVTTRLVGALVMGHGDDSGLRVPPRLAPVQVVVVLVRAEDGAPEAAARVVDDLRRAGVRVELDDRVATGFGRRAVEWELKGVPVRVEIGPRDLADGNATLVRRDTGEKAAVPLGGLVAEATDALEKVQVALHRLATERGNARTVKVSTVDEAREAAQSGFARVPWDAIRDDEGRLAESAVTVRCLQRDGDGLPASSTEPGLVATVGKAY
jgi:prolyl-tRNA synthetase